jgi:hypothetical protein
MSSRQIAGAGKIVAGGKPVSGKRARLEILFKQIHMTLRGANT